MPGTAQPAIQEGKYAATCQGPPLRRARIEAVPLPRPRLIAAIGRNSAVADLFGKFRVGGPIAFLIWGVVHLAYLVGWGNRYEAVAGWRGRSSPATAASA